MTTSTTTPTRTETGSQLINALEDVWAAIQKRHPDVPDVIMITGSGNMGLGLVWGHYGHDFWANGRFIVDAAGTITKDRKPELFVSGETLGVGAAKTVQTLLHEAAHALARVRDIKDTSRQRRYHNGEFRKLAEELGLTYPDERPSDTLGYSAMIVTPATREEYADVIDELDAAIALSMDLPGWMGGLLGLGGTGGGGHSTRRPRNPGKPRTGLHKASCGCGRNIRVAPSVLDQAPITCGECGEEFALV